MRAREEGKDFDYWVHTTANLFEAALLAPGVAPGVREGLDLAKLSTAVMVAFTYGFVFGTPDVLEY